MTAKEELIEMIRQMPEDSSTAELLDSLYVRLQVEEGVRQLDNGEGIPHEEVVRRMQKWLA